MATFKHTGGVSKFRDKLISGMIAHGYEREYAEQTFRQLEGFGSYGFPESHAASFALIAYASSWLKCHHPDVFCAALLNAQPMGFYAPAQIVRDARDHGVELSLGKKRGGKAQCRLDWSDVVAYGEGLIAVLVPDEADETCALRLRRLAEAFGDRAYSGADAPPPPERCAAPP